MYITEGGLSDRPGDQPDAYQVELCTRWLQEHALPGKGWTRKTSRDLHFEAQLSTGPSVSNGAFIEAARRMGFEFKPAGRGSRFAVFKMLLKPDKI